MHSYSRVDHCNAVLAGASKVTTDKLQRMLNAAARAVSGTLKFDRGLLTTLAQCTAAGGVQARRHGV